MNHDFFVKKLGEAKIINPIKMHSDINYINENDRILETISLKFNQKYFKESEIPSSFEQAGPRKKIYFNPKKIKAAIVTCGGLCPGLNAVIRGICHQLWERYQVKNVLGVRYGYQGLGKNGEIIVINRKSIEGIHRQGGTILGTSRGTPSIEEIVDSLKKHKISILFTIGGDGTMRGALKISKEIERRKLNISIIGIPKTIDNDIPYVRRSFGFDTAVEKAENVVSSAYEEAKGHKNGVGLVRLMGRHTGFIAANTTVSTGDVDICLVPEVLFNLEGSEGLYLHLKNLLKKKGNALIVVAEGAGQRHLNIKSRGKDDSGNKKLGDIGLYLKKKIGEHFKKTKTLLALKYIDPSYIIRSAAANTSDRNFCFRLAQNAVHAGMAGKTSMLIGYWHGVMTHIPMRALTDIIKRMNPKGTLWFNVLEATGQMD